MADYACIICGNTDGNGRIVRPKGRTALDNASARHGDELYRLLASPGDHFVHDTCYKKYTRATNVVKSQNHITETVRPTLSLRSDNVHFDYNNNCLICAQKLDLEGIKRRPDQYSPISTIEMMKKETSILQQTLLSACDKRQDSLAVELKGRIMFAGDIRALDAKYHRSCMQRFLSNRSVSGNDQISNKTCDSQKVMKNEPNDNAFQELCQWLLLEENTSQYTLQDLQSQLMTYLPPDVPPYSTKHIKRRLIERFGKDVLIAEIVGKANVVTFSKKAATILNESYGDAAMDNSHSENCQLAKTVGSLIKEDLNHMEQPQNIYPTPDDIDLDKLEGEIPATLKQLLDSMFYESRSEAARQKHNLIKVAVAHTLMQACGKKSYVSPLLLSVGLFIHQTTRSRLLIDVLSSLGLCVSYSQIMAFERSAVVSQSVNDLPPGLTRDTSGVGFCQWVADNFDYNEDTSTGHDSTHVMGIITCQTPSSSKETKFVVNRRDVSVTDVAKAGDFSKVIKEYKPQAKDAWVEVKMKSLHPVNVDTITYQLIDELWLFSSCLHPEPPNWQGFMSHIVEGVFQCSSVVYNPMIPLNPGTDDAVYSTMNFVLQQAKKMGMCCATLTFDQPLYLKAYKIKAESHQEFQHLALRLGGFHQLMSFLGSGCKLMESSGLEDMWATVYARKSIPKMMEGKAYTKTLRALLLTDSALHCMLLSSSIGSLCNMKTTQEDSVRQEEDTVDDVLEDMIREIETGADDEQEGIPLIKELQLEYSALLKKTVSPAEVVLTKPLLDLHDKIEQIKRENAKSRTGKLWIMLMKFVSIIRMFIRSERTGNWQLHIKATQDMMPFFTAAGHNNYTKCCRLYLQDCQNLCSCISQAFENGLFTIHRNKNMFWNGTWSDMTIEQCLMRAGKTCGGLINITHNDSARTKWLLSAHIVAQYTDALKMLTSVSNCTWSEQHKEMLKGVRKRDHVDLQKFLAFLQTHNPFSTTDPASLINIANGVVADERVNAEDAIQVGTLINEKLNDQRLGDLKLKKADHVQTFSVMRKAIKVEGEDVRISSTELYQRLLSIACTQGPPDPSLFSFEMAPVAPALFDDNGNMRKAQKHLLAKYILQLSPSITQNFEVSQTACRVFDGCALIHRLSWPKVGNLAVVCESYVSFVLNSRTPGNTLCVIFDTYTARTTTKAPEQKRRRLMHAAYPEVFLQPTTPVPGNKQAFLANVKNKQNFIHMLSSYLVQAGVLVEHAEDEGDADIIIVRKAMELAMHKDVIVIADDTDILVLLMYHANRQTNVFMETKQNLISINIAQRVLSLEACMCLPFVHAMTGCDTTSAFYGLGKVKALKVLQSSKDLLVGALEYGKSMSSKEQILKVGEYFVCSLYGGHGKSLEEIRFAQFTSPKYVALERMPPTSRACYYHCLRVHLQTNTWMNLKTLLRKEEYGFKCDSESVTPVITDMPPAPPELLKSIRCSCKTATCTSCTCFKNRLPCTSHCNCEGQCGNSPAITDSEDEN